MGVGLTQKRSVSYAKVFTSDPSSPYICHVILRRKEGGRRMKSIISMGFKIDNALVVDCGLVYYLKLPYIDHDENIERILQHTDKKRESL